MLKEIQKLLNEKPKHAIKMIRNNNDLWLWIEQHCDPNCIDNKTKVYTAITGEKILCPCNSHKLRKLISIKDGLSFCGPAGKCETARLSVSNNCIIAAQNWDKEAAKNKRENTNKEKYGVINIGQTATAKKAHHALYQDKNKVQKILNGMQANCLKKYGVKNVALIPEIALKRAETKKNNMMEKFGRTHETQLHISNENYKILSNKELFTEALLQYGRIGLADKLSVSASTISRHHDQFDLNIIIPFSSSYEMEIVSWLTSLSIVVEKDRSICKPKEIDMLMKDYNLAIEFNGLYHHVESSGKDKYYHFNKTKKCFEQGIQLLHIFEDEWINKKQICKSIVSAYLRKFDNIIPARKCEIKEITNKEIRSFLEDNHLQGYSTASKNIVLIQNNEIIMGLTFGKPRYNKNIEWELIRLVTRKNTNVIGGTQKLWSYFLKIYQPNSIVSYCDRRWFTGKIYAKLGFLKQKDAIPTYWYTDTTNRFHRSRFTKKNAVKAAFKMENNMYSLDELTAFTENYITKDILGLDRIWDCGQDTWIWKK
jgi:hypothetical protein